MCTAKLNIDKDDRAQAINPQFIFKVYNLSTSQIT